MPMTSILFLKRQFIATSSDDIISKRNKFLYIYIYIYIYIFFFFFAFSKSRFNFEHFQQEDDPHTDVYLNLGNPKNMVREMSKKSHFSGPFDN